MGGRGREVRRPLGLSAGAARRRRPPAPRNPDRRLHPARGSTREGLKPSPEADRRTLIRRVSLDLTGIPPTPEETAAFVKDTSPDAYEKLVDRLLASPRYAEQQAMHWLDAVRYADTCGFHGDNAFPAWPYRDYVLHAFRDNKPFDEFTREQLAGDLMPNATRRAAGGVGVQPPESHLGRGRPAAEGISGEVRAPTACARPSPSGWAARSAAPSATTTSSIRSPSRDFYSMKAFFADIKETGLVPDRGKDAWGSQLALPTPEQQQQLEELKARARRGARRGWRPRWRRWSRGARRGRSSCWRSYEAGELAWQHPASDLREAGERRGAQDLQRRAGGFHHLRRRQPDADRKPGNGLVVAGGPNPDNETYTVTFKPGAGTWTALGHRGGAGRGPARACAWRAAPIAW